MKLGNNQFEKITVKILKQRIEQNSKLKYLNCDYENQNSKVLLRCECGREFTCAYRKLRENNYRTRCEHCRREIANKNRAITTENRFREFVKNNSEDELVEYYNSRECCVFKCHRRGKEYKMRSDTFRDGSRCSCDLNSKGGEKKIISPMNLKKPLKVVEVKRAIC